MCRCNNNQILIMSHVMCHNISWLRFATFVNQRICISGPCTDLKAAPSPKPVDIAKWCRFVSKPSAHLVRLANPTQRPEHVAMAAAVMYAPLAPSHRAPLITSEQENLNLHIQSHSSRESLCFLIVFAANFECRLGQYFYKTSSLKPFD